VKTKGKTISQKKSNKSKVNGQNGQRKMTDGQRKKKSEKENNKSARKQRNVK
jgi:hypothetical protein